MKINLKRGLALALTLMLLFSFASCKGKTDTETTTAPVDESKLPAGVGETVIKKSFSDPDDEKRIVYTLDLVLPSVDAKSFAQAEMINYCFAEVAQRKESHAKNNVANAVNWFNAHADAVPWCIIARSELTFSNSDYLCFRIDYQYGYGSKALAGNSESYCISTETGLVCKISHFLANGAKQDDLADTVCADIITRSVNEYKISTLRQNIKTAEDIADSFSFDNFYLTDNGITFYFNPGIIAEIDKGRIEVSYSAADIAEYLTLPTAA